VIRIESITLVNFRGAKRLTLNPAGANFAIRGPNGTGKSGVVDAVEFGLTGNITRLTGRGAGGLSVKTHGPHVDSRETPKDAKVLLSVFIPSLNKKVTIERSIAAPRDPILIPDEADIKKLLEKLRRKFFSS